MFDKTKARIQDKIDSTTAQFELSVDSLRADMLVYAKLTGLWMGGVLFCLLSMTFIFAIALL